jgi:hypothetical protein
MTDAEVLEALGGKREVEVFSRYFSADSDLFMHFGHFPFTGTSRISGWHT